MTSRALIKQYQQSPTIKKLTENNNFYFDKKIDDKFFNFCWNIDTAQGFGLDYWGRIVGVSRLLKVTDLEDKLGFRGSLLNPFNQGVFFAGKRDSDMYELTDDAFRILILTKALTNISATNYPTMNRVLNNLFKDRGRAYTSKVGTMAIRYTFEFFLKPFERAILLKSGAIPRPAGVDLFIAQIPVNTTFGFNGTGCQPFGQGSFFNQGALENAS